MEGTLFLRRIPKGPKRVLVLRTDRIGDFVLSLPVFEVLSNRLGLTVEVLCRPMTLPLLDHNPHISLVHSYTEELEGHLAEKLSQDPFDALLVLVNDEVARRMVPKLHHIPIRIGPLSKPGMLLHYTHPAVQKRSHSIKNEAQYNLDLTRAFGWDGTQAPSPKLYFDALEEQAFGPWLAELEPQLDLAEGYLVVHAGMSGSALNWPQKHYAELLDLLSAKQQVILTGASAEETQNNQALIAALPEAQQAKVFNLSQKLTLRRLALLCHFAQAFVGPSTGPTHVAAAAGAPVVSFYPPVQVMSKTRWAPFGAKGTLFEPQVLCGQKYKCIGEDCPHFYCMDRITPEQVATACMANARIEVHP